MPRLWSETIAEHRRSVREATLHTTAALVARHGLRGVTMSQIAQATGIGRATLYRYFPDVESIVLAWHERQVATHLARLTEVRDQSGDALTRLKSALEAYALIQHELRLAHGSEMATLLHRRPHVADARRQLSDFVRELLEEGVAAGHVRADVAPAELASYCLHALAAAATLDDEAAVRRLVDVTLDGLRGRG